MPKSSGEPNRGATIADVARLAGVSAGTVSLVLNGSTRISGLTREKVREAAAALHYQPNHAAASLRRQATQTIALVVPDITNPVYVEIARTVQHAAKERGYHLHLISTENQLEEEQHAFDVLTARRVDGLILISLKGSGVVERPSGPVVIIGRLGVDRGECDNVTVASAAGAAQAVRHLWETGRQRVAFINGEQGTLPADERLRGVRQAFEASGKTMEPELTVQADFTLEGGYRAAKVLLRRERNFNGLFCANDLMAVGALRALHEHGLRVPDDVALIGMDDTRDCLITTPTLSSVSLLAAERGRLAAELLFDRLAGGQDLPFRQLTVSPVLIPRDSTRGKSSQGGAA